MEKHIIISLNDEQNSCAVTPPDDFEFSAETVAMICNLLTYTLIEGVEDGMKEQFIAEVSERIHEEFMEGALHAGIVHFVDDPTEQMLQPDTFRSRLFNFDTGLKHPLLRTAFSAFGNQSDVEYNSELNGLFLHYFKWPENGPTGYDSGENRWYTFSSEAVKNIESDIKTRPTDSANLEKVETTVLVYSSGQVEISPDYYEFDESLGDMLFVSHIISGCEINELMDFYFSVNASEIHSSKYVRKNVSELIEGVYISYLKDDGEIVAHEFVPSVFRSQGPDCVSSIYSFFNCNMPESLISKCEKRLYLFSLAKFGFWKWIKSRNLDSSLGNRIDLNSDDIMLIPRIDSLHGCQVHYFDHVKEIGQESIQISFPMIALRLKKGVSRMWFVDYLKHAVESDGIIESLFQEWERLPKVLSSIPISLPKGFRDQVAESIERRSARADYVKYLEDAINMREPISDIRGLYRKRQRVAKMLSREFIDDLISFEKPLPFFLEYPYRCFRREGDQLRRLKSAWRLLSSLAKVPLFLVVEELLQGDHPIGVDVLEELESKPLSDGALCGLHQRVGRALSSGKESSVEVFANLIGILEDNEGLSSIVSRRNRLNHEPFDHEGFLQIIEEEAPRILNCLRESLHGCRFIVPKSLKFEGGRKWVVAEDICSSDVLFQSVNFDTLLSLEDFPTNQIVVQRDGCCKTVKLGRLITTATVMKESRDFGIFDRVGSGGKREFVFIRSEGSTNMELEGYS